MNTKATLRSLDLPAEADDLDSYARDRGVPVLGSVRSLPVPVVPTEAPKPKPAATTTKIAIEVPDYLPAQLKRLALERNCTIRFLLLDALHRAGCTIAPEDRLKDGRRHPQALETVEG
jgi:hypothetical protein